MCYLSCIKICSNKCPTYINDVFWLAENIIINMRNSYLNLSDSFWKTSTGQSSLSYTGPAIWTHFQNFSRKHKISILSNIIWNTDDFSNPNLWNITGFDYALTFLKIFFVFLLVFSLSSSMFFFLLHSDWGSTVKLRLFTCFVLSLPYCFFLTDVRINIKIKALSLKP